MRDPPTVRDGHLPTPEHDRIERAVMGIIAKQLGVPVSRVVAEARLIEDLGADSLALAQVALALEAHYEIDVPDEDMLRLDAVRHVVDYVTTFVKLPEGGRP